MSQTAQQSKVKLEPQIRKGERERTKVYDLIILL